MSKESVDSIQRKVKNGDYFIIDKSGMKLSKVWNHFGVIAKRASVRDDSETSNLPTQKSLKDLWAVWLQKSLRIFEVVWDFYISNAYCRNSKIRVWYMCDRPSLQGGPKVF